MTVYDCMQSNAIGNAKHIDIQEVVISIMQRVESACCCT